MDAAAVNLTHQQFRRICRLVYDASGISIKRGKEALVRARLMKRLRRLDIDSVEEYLRLLEEGADGAELGALIDVMTTNQTSFFREYEHFVFLRDQVLPVLEGPRLRFWSAACSSGEEPYSLAMLLCECLPRIHQRDVLVLGTDISRPMLEKARAAVYPRRALEGLPAPEYRKYFAVRQGRGEAHCQVVGEVRRLVRLAWLNLQGPWPMKGPFDVIFCRNVMIYFDRATQQRLVERFWQLLPPGGYLLVGHSEGLSGIRHRFRYVKPAVYRK